MRTREEFEQSHVAGSRHAPGGQLVQASDEYVGVRNARVVLVDPERVRAVMTASWLNQMGWNDVYVLRGRGGLRDGVGPRGRRPRLAEVEDGDRDVGGRDGARPFHQPALLPLAHSGRVVGRALPPRPRFSSTFDDVKRLVLTSEDGILAHLAAPEAAAQFPQAEIRVLEGGNAAWKGPTESGVERATTTRDDVWYKPYDHASDYKKHARDYLSWEVALVEQIKRDPTIRFRSY